MKTLSAQHLFDIPQDIVYLNCASLSPQLKSVGGGEMGRSAKGQPMADKAQGLVLTTRKDLRALLAGS